jgi:hypothetical protein
LGEIPISSESFDSPGELILWNGTDVELEELEDGVSQNDDFLAGLLDYPTLLPNREELERIQSGKVDSKIVEIGYFDDETLITSYGARNTKQDLDLVKLHFERYKNACKGFMDLSWSYT